jgi:hypothetical protein
MQNISKLISEYLLKGPKFQLRKLEKDLLRYQSELTGLSNNPLEDLYLIKEGLSEIPQCPVCQKHRMFRDYKKGYRPTCHDKACRDRNCADSIKKSFIDKYGVDNPSLVKEIQQKREQTFIDKYGVSNPYASDEVKSKIKQTFIDNYGCDNPLKNQDIKHKLIETNLKRHGVSNTYQIQKVKDVIKEKYGDNFGFGSNMFIEKSKKSFQEKYGVDHIGQSTDAHEKITETQEQKYGGRGFKSEKTSGKIKKTMSDRYGVEKPMESDLIKSRIVETCLEKYGEKHAMQNVKVFDKWLKSSFSYKEFKFPSGTIVDVQGYEPFALHYLLNNGYVESDIIVNNKDIEKYAGKIYYNNSGKRSRYYPDIYIKSEKRIIEVKSEYTYRKNESINILKKNACIEKDLRFDFIIIDQEFLVENKLI